MTAPMLPQDDPKLADRAVELRQRCKDYQYNHEDVPGLAMVDGLPTAELPSLEWGWLVLKRFLALLKNNLFNDDAPGRPRGKLDVRGFLANSRAYGRAVGKLRKVSRQDFEQVAAELAAEVRLADPRSGVDLLDYEELFTSIDLPEIAASFMEDTTFARMRTSGPNPVVIRQVSTPGGAFPVSDKLFRSAPGFADDRLADAGAQGRLFLVDYAALDGIEPGVLDGKQKHAFAPKALFALPVQGGPGLLPVAIQCGQDPSRFPVFTPQHGEAWMMAKTTVSCADGNYHELISHLGRTHLLIEPFVLATRRQLASTHPLHTLLTPHFEGTVFINWAAVKFLINDGGQVDRILAGKIQSSRATSVASLQGGFSFNASMLPRDLETRGVMSESLPYRFRDDALLHWQAIHAWVADYLQLYYRSDAEVRADTELSAWAEELTSDLGGRVQGFGEADGKILSLQYLIDAVTMIIYTAGPQHAAVNFPQNELMSFTPAMPLAAYRAAPENRDATGWMEMLPHLSVSELQLMVTALLGGVHYTRLGEYDRRHFADPRVATPLAAFQAQLESIDGEIADRNRRAVRTDVEPYHYLRPGNVPQSINI